MAARRREGTAEVGKWRDNKKSGGKEKDRNLECQDIFELSYTLSKVKKIYIQLEQNYLKLLNF